MPGYVRIRGSRRPDSALCAPWPSPGDCKGRTEDGDVYGGRTFHYERATNDVTIIPSGSDVFVRRAEQNRIYHVHVTGPGGRGHLVRQHLVGTPWMPATGLLRFETGASYACKGCAST
ncbi:hypothetical protein FHP25_33850 [Vineibacter terrae]|uniref:Uncharacterized protein n=1 Tax=Vineibacter terrae TaxID=2586908 RepID=A0A5C8PAR4_9HYPH|nr:hypothetical protein [Vineibacter terrae]TXL70638.1 hypothetical protein FHP25_33850 [Vineibacter terrae]